jgi:hypothetical protein
LEEKLEAVNKAIKNKNSNNFNIFEERIVTSVTTRAFLLKINISL